MTMKTWLLNGEPILVEAAQAIEPFDQEYNGGVFETFRSFLGHFWRIEDHIKRFKHSAKLLEITIPITDDVLVDSLKSLVDLTGDNRYKVWTDGVDWWIKVLPLDNLDFSKGVTVVDQVFHRPVVEAKYGGGFYPQARDYCRKHNAFEVLWFDEQDYLLEGSITNVFVMIDGQLCTPALGNILPGLMRQWVLDQDFKVKQCSISREMLLSADEIFCTNMVRGIIPVAIWGDWKSQSFSMAEMLITSLHSNLPK